MERHTNSVARSPSHSACVIRLIGVHGKVKAVRNLGADRYKDASSTFGDVENRAVDVGRHIGCPDFSRPQRQPPRVPSSFEHDLFSTYAVPHGAEKTGRLAGNEANTHRRPCSPCDRALPTQAPIPGEHQHELMRDRLQQLRPEPCSGGGHVQHHARSQYRTVAVDDDRGLTNGSTRGFPPLDVHRPDLD